jgi:hypothetical protein
MVLCAIIFDELKFWIVDWLVLCVVGNYTGIIHIGIAHTGKLFLYR